MALHLEVIYDSLEGPHQLMNPAAMQEEPPYQRFYACLGLLPIHRLQMDLQLIELVYGAEPGQQPQCERRGKLLSLIRCRAHLVADMCISLTTRRQKRSNRPKIRLSLKSNLVRAM